MAAVGALLLAGASPGGAQELRLGTWDGALEGTSNFARQTTKSSDAASSRIESMGSLNQLTIRNSGISIYDPRLVTLTLGGTFGLAQEWLTTESGTASRDGTLYGYETFASILPEGAYSLNLFASRNQSVLTRELAGRSEAEVETRGATLFAREIYVPSSLTVRQEILKDEARIAGTVSRRDTRRTIVRYEGQRGWVDAEADGHYEYVDESDQVLPLLSFRSHEARLNHGADFGSELDWHWDSRTGYFTRSGSTDLTLLTIDEVLRADHTERLRGEYRYFLTRTETSGAATTTHGVTAGLRHQLYESLTTSPALDAIFQTVPGGEKETYRGRLDVRYSKRLPGGGRLSAGLGGSLQYEDDRFDTPETLVPQEAHTAASPVALPIPLANAFVVASSVVVTKTAVGPLPLGCVPFPGPPTPLVVGRDFTLRTVGDSTEIVPIPCTVTSPGITAGDSVTVDYRFTVPRSLTFTTGTWRADLSVDYGWIRPFLIYERTEQSLLAGQEGRFLDNQESTTVGLELRYDGARVRASARGEARRFASDRVSYDSYQASQFAAVTLLRNLTLSVTGDESLITFKNLSRESRTLAGRAALTYVFDSTLFGEVSGGFRTLTDTLLPEERTVEASARIQWFYRKLEVTPSLDYIQRERGTTGSQEIRAMVRTLRRF